MLKIKPEVDLKELEKFGFEYIDEDFETCCEIYSRSCGLYKSIIIFVEDRKILKVTDGKTLELKDEDIKDLIQARIGNKGVIVWK